MSVRSLSKIAHIYRLIVTGVVGNPARNHRGQCSGWHRCCVPGPAFRMSALGLGCVHFLTSCEVSIRPRNVVGGRRSGHQPGRALQLQRLDLPTTDEPFAAVIRCTSDPGKVDKRTRSKWSRMLRYAAEYKSNSEPLVAFVQRKGGINKCAERFTRCLGRRQRRDQTP